MKLLRIEDPFEGNDEINEATKEALASLKNDPDVYPCLSELKLSKAEVKAGLATLLEYQDDVHACLHCPGLEACPKARSGYRMSLTRERGNLHPNYSPCDLKQKYDRGLSLYCRRDFPDEWLSQDVRNIERSVSTRNPLLKAMALILKRDSDQWLYVWGDTKSGKSFVLACFSNMIARIESGVAYIDTRSCFEELVQQSFDAKTKAKFRRNMDLLSSCPLLVLDEFGKEVKNRYVFDNILYPLLKKRDELGLLTAFSSRYMLDKAMGLYASKVDSSKFEELLGIMKKRTKKCYDISGIRLYS